MSHRLTVGVTFNISAWLLIFAFTALPWYQNLNAPQLIIRNQTLDYIPALQPVIWLLLLPFCSLLLLILSFLVLRREQIRRNPFYWIGVITVCAVGIEVLIWQFTSTGLPQLQSIIVFGAGYWLTACIMGNVLFWGIDSLFG